MTAAAPTVAHPHAVAAPVPLPPPPIPVDERHVVHLRGVGPPPIRHHGTFGRFLIWLGERPYATLAAVVHVVVLIGLYSLVTETREEPPKEKPLEIAISMDDNPDDRSDQQPDQGAGAHNNTIVQPDVPAGTATDADAATNPGGISATPDEPTDWKVQTPQGAAPIRALRPMSGIGGSMGGQGVRGDGQSGSGSASAGYESRGDRRGSGVARNGGSAASENAVDAGLRWLAHHIHTADQIDSVTQRVYRMSWWRPDKFPLDARDMETGAETSYPNKAVDGEIGRTEYEVGLTALCALAFLGAGHAPGTATWGDIMSGVKEWLLRQQDRNGRFGRSNTYNHAIATMCLSEMLLMTHDESLRAPLQKAVDLLVSMQCEHGGWDYEHRPTLPRNDTSITTWCLLALKEANTAGIPVPRTAFVRVIHHFRRMLTPEGYTVYADKRKDDYRLGAGMVGSSLFCRRLLGAPADDPMVARQATILMANLPDPARLTVRNAEGLDSSYYTWYIGTLACFFTGGDCWSRWNATMRETAIKLQRTGGQLRGSWDGKDRWSWAGGRLYATAMMVLTLEIYYRYVPAYMLADGRDLEPFNDPDHLYGFLGEDLRNDPILSQLDRD
ncbi:MAG: prenyltransferase/squalene oxidase repeat-containing protein [Planctomycetota bacterium]